MKSTHFPLMLGSITLFAYTFGTRAFGKLFTELSRGAFYHIGRRSMLQPPIRISGAAHIAVGDRVFFGPNSWLEVIDPERPVIEPAISLGDGMATTGFCTISAAKSVVIEPRVLMARNIYISDHTHAYSALDRPIKEQGIAKIAPVRICEGAWLGQGVIVCPGVTIGRNAVIGANSIVRHDVPDFCVAAGAPATVLRQIDNEKPRAPGFKAARLLPKLQRHQARPMSGS